MALSVRSQEILKDRLSWVEDAFSGLKFALGPDMLYHGAHVEETGDPLSYIVTIALRSPVAKGSRSPIRTWLRGWAKQGDCHVPRIHITDEHIRCEVFIEYRHRKGRFNKRLKKRRE